MEFYSMPHVSSSPMHAVPSRLQSTMDKYKLKPTLSLLKKLAFKSCRKRKPSLIEDHHKP